MKKFAGYFVALLLVLALPLTKVSAQANPFEGTITWNMTMPMMGSDDAHPVVINVKGKKMETNMDMGAMGTVKTYADMETKKGFMVMGKMGYEMNLASDSAAISHNPMDTVRPTPTGQTATIAGHPAQEYLLKGIKSKGGTMDMSIWVASDFPKEMLGAFKHMNDNPGEDPKEKNAMRFFADQGLAPVKIVANSDGQVAMTMEFVKYEQKSLDDALFVPPTDIKYMPMPSMGGMH